MTAPVFERRWWLAVMAMSNAVGSYAADGTDPLQACVDIASSAQRLACYDQLAGRRRKPLDDDSNKNKESTSPAQTAPARLDNFGLPAVKHPASSVPASINGNVVAVGRSASGAQTVELEGGLLWQLEEPDPLLKEGDAVTIKRAALGSFVLSTQAGRTHRARRLR